ncbi:rho GTPase-activating protein 17-like [Cotesia glomerata]|uniref:rho GTPase-activating protein 17-like n=1 Tax=Cotesia glomerata TaxID=32391 RepID=UPI001D02FE6D|nr:rho GTPase-activating protein 17-like [Cotesia glomerata]
MQDTTSNEHTKTPEKTQTGNSKEQPPAAIPSSDRYSHPYIKQEQRDSQLAQTYNNGLITYAYPPMNYSGNGPPMQNTQPRQPPPALNPPMQMIPPGLPPPRPPPAGN